MATAAKRIPQYLRDIEFGAKTNCKCCGAEIPEGKSFCHYCALAERYKKVKTAEDPDWLTNVQKQIRIWQAEYFGENGLKTDCFAYHLNTNRCPECRIKKHLDCDVRVCQFYQTREDHTAEKKRKENENHGEVC